MRWEVIKEDGWWIVPNCRSLSNCPSVSWQVRDGDNCVKHVSVDLQLTPLPRFFPGFFLHCLMSHIFVCSVCLRNGNIGFPLYLQSLYQVCLLQPFVQQDPVLIIWHSLLIIQGLGLGAVSWAFTVQIYPRWHYGLAFEYVKVGEGSCSGCVQGIPADLEACIADGACSRFSWECISCPVSAPVSVLTHSHAHL